tara:strand:+ start:341 stop:520 length:180 start_codon:yes stop_codon:yes gene_type:complete
MRDRKTLRAQRHLSQPKTVDNHRGEELKEKNEVFQQTKTGLKKKVMYSGQEYSIDMTKE